MRGLVTIILTFAAMCLSVSISFDTLTFFTLDISSGENDVFPICYLKVSFANDFGISLEDYMILAHETFNIGSLELMKPRYYYIWYKGNKFDLDLGRFKAKHYNTRVYESLRVGGIRTDIFGIDASYKMGMFKIGGIYDIKRE